MEQDSFKLSPSSIRIMIECPRCFWLQLKKRIRRPETIFPSLPSGMDKVLKEHFDRFMEKGELPPEIREHGIANGYRLFNDKQKLSIWRDALHGGIQYKDNTSGMLLRGAIDNLLSNGNKIIVLDYKTRGYPLKEDTAEYYQEQMDIYNFLLRKNGYETEDYAYLLFYYPKEVMENGEVIFDTKLIKLSTSMHRGEKLFNDAIEILQSDEVPEASDECKFCGYVEERREI